MRVRVFGAVVPVLVMFLEALGILLLLSIHEMVLFFQ